MSSWTWKKIRETNCACYWWYEASCLYLVYQGTNQFFITQAENDNYKGKIK